MGEVHNGLGRVRMLPKHFRQWCGIVQYRSDTSYSVESDLHGNRTDGGDTNTRTHTHGYVHIHTSHTQKLRHHDRTEDGKDCKNRGMKGTR